MDDVLAKYLIQLRPGQGYSAHLMRAAYITTALENSAKPEDVQQAIGHADPAPTQLYDRRRFMPTKSEALIVSCGEAEETRI
jgi:site-specific recombinase XerD